MSTFNAEIGQNTGQNKAQSERAPHVLLLHGVLMNPFEMRFLGNQLKKHGFQVHYIFYQSVLKNSIQNSQLVHKKICKLNLPDLHIVAHSLGGLITMHLLNQFDDIPPGRVVMLGSPVNGSSVAQKIQKWAIIDSLLSQSMSNALSGKNIPDWKCNRDWGMIAGTRSQGLGIFTGGLTGINDGSVLLEETRHPRQTAHIQVNTSHTGLLFSKQVAQLCSRFLNTGTFSE